jgi:hypothetical protein
LTIILLRKVDEHISFVAVTQRNRAKHVKLATDRESRRQPSPSSVIRISQHREPPVDIPYVTSAIIEP